MDLRLKHKRVLVTGGNRGIGRCCALSLAREGARVCITARDKNRLDNTVEDIRKIGGVGFAVAGDLTIPVSCQEVVNRTVDVLDGIDILINCAGAAGGGVGVSGTPSSRFPRALLQGLRSSDGGGGPDRF